MIIRSLREDRGWSQEQLADISGISVRTIQRIETGNRGSLESLKCLAAVFETTIPDLREDKAMTDKTEPIAHPEPAREPPKAESNGLTEEDRAALKYARNLQRYDDYYDDKNGWGDDYMHPDDADLPAHERNVLQQVRRERGFYRTLGIYAIILTVLLAINLLTGPNYIWVVWPALGMGISLLFHASYVFGNTGWFGDDWERSQVEKRLRKLAHTNPKR
ncbi:MAG: helix-turn-helix domain-containing protein [Paracoccaceae bacterium]